MIKIPWTKKDVPKHKKGLTEKQKEKWVEIANSVLKQCKKDGGKDCEAKAIRTANSKVGSSSNSEEQGMGTKKLKAPKGRFTFTSNEPLIELADNGEGEDKRFSMEAYTGNEMPDIFEGWICVDVGGIQFGGRKRYPILEDHSWDKKIGVKSGKPSTENNVVRFDDIKPLSNKDAQEFMQNLEDGFPYQASISVKPVKIEEYGEGEKAEVNGKTLKGPGIVLRNTKFREASVCVFGRDENTSVQSMSDGQEEEFEVEVMNFSGNEEGAEEFKANNPDYDGTETKDWSSVPKGMKAVIGSYYKHHPDAERDEDDEINDVDEMPAAMKKWIANLTLGGKPTANTWDKLFYFPVVNHSTKKLNKNGLVSAKAYAKQEGKNDIWNKADSLLKKHWGEDDDDENNKNSGGSSMDLEQFKEQYPELYKQFADQLKEKDNEIGQKDQKIQELSQTNEELSGRVDKLEKSEQIRRERDLKAHAESIKDKKLSDSTIPDRLHDKVKRHVDHNKFVDSEGKFDEESFSQKVDEEINDWVESLSDLDLSVVQGHTPSGSDSHENETEKFDALSDEMVSLAVKEKDKKKD